MPGVDIEVEQPLAHLISHMVSGVYAQIAIKVVGDDLDTLLATAEKVKTAIKDIPGVTPPVIEPIQQTPELHIRLRPDDLARYGLTREYVGRIMQTALQGEVTSRRFSKASVALTCWSDWNRPIAPTTPTWGDCGSTCPASKGQVELASLADIGEGVGPNAVNRENARRRIVIRCNTQDRDLASAVAEIQQRVKERVEMPEGYFVEYARPVREPAASHDADRLAGGRFGRRHVRGAHAALPVGADRAADSQRACRRPSSAACWRW